MIAAEYDALVPALEGMGLVNEDAPGMEAIENAMALLEPPAGDGGIGVSVKEVETYEGFGYLQVTMDAFEISQAIRDEATPTFPERWEEHCDPANPSRVWIAFVDGTLVGTAGASFGEVGGYLFGGAVTEAARGRGVYRALTLARWQAAEERGTPALTVMAGRMSRPLCERLGFVLVGQVRVFVDTLTG